MSAFASRRVLVTGVSGFVGHHLARVLHAQGAQVFGTGIDADETPSVVRDGLLQHYAPNFDLRDTGRLRDSIAEWKPDAIVHLAAQSSAARSFENPAETFEINTLGTWALLEAVRERTPAARVLIVGTSEVYGPQPEGTRVAESAPFRPVSPYALSKAAADAAAEVASERWGLDVMRVRAFGHTGPGQTNRFVIPGWCEQIAAIERGRGEPVLRVGNLQVTRDFTDARDVVEAYCALLERGLKGVAYNVCRGEGVALRAVIERLVRMARVPLRIEVDPERMRPADVPYLVGDPSRIQRDTGWSAQIPFERTLEDVLGEWRVLATRD